MATYILGIESSCDDTAAAVLRDGEILSNVVANQEVHAQYGGVVPEVASRAHQVNIIPVVDRALQQAGISPDQLSAIAFTRGPGLIGSLLVGVTFAKTLALSLNIPIIEVNHMQAHVLSVFAEPPYPTFPFLCLTVSGGHTQILKVKDYLDMEVLGETKDDAAGEAFDKTGKMLGLAYPAGPIIDQLAQQGEPIYDFPKPQVPGLDFSFSGLKTAILYFLRDQKRQDSTFIEREMNNICASVQQRIVSILTDKLEEAVQQTGIRQITIAGGVSANSGLRRAVHQLGKKQGWDVFIPRLEYSTDNAAMIAITGYYKFQQQDFSSQEVTPVARWSPGLG
jgi:N6-L-threonylcarbamoyladenine synthase